MRQRVKMASKKRKRNTASSIESTKCTECNQPISSVTVIESDPRVIYFDELVVLTDPRLTSVVSDKEDVSSQIPQHKITQYFLTDSFGHLVSLQDGLIEDGKQIFLHGKVLDITSDVNEKNNIMIPASNSVPSLNGGSQDLMEATQSSLESRPNSHPIFCQENHMTVIEDSFNHF